MKAKPNTVTTYMPALSTRKTYCTWICSLVRFLILFTNFFRYHRIQLILGKVEMITGVGIAMQPSLQKWNNPIRPIRSSGKTQKLDIPKRFSSISTNFIRSFRSVYGDTGEQCIIRHKWQSSNSKLWNRWCFTSNCSGLDFKQTWNQYRVCLFHS